MREGLPLIFASFSPAIFFFFYPDNHTLALHNSYLVQKEEKREAAIVRVEEEEDRRASSRVIRLAAGGDAWRVGRRVRRFTGRARCAPGASTLPAGCSGGEWAACTNWGI